jgi:DNA-binding response OmpR family regulator
MTPTKFQTVPLTELAARRIVPDTTPVRPLALVVDDDWTIADPLVAILNSAGFAASAAYDGETALKAALLIPPQVLITDVDMPGINGIQLAIAVRKAIPDCRIVIFSGHATTRELLVEARNNGHRFAVLAKPVHLKDLLTRLGVTAPTTIGIDSHP